MEVILLERVAKLGNMGDVVRVKDGFARNFLLPRNKALRANADNKARFEGMKAELEKQSLERKGEAGKVAAKVDGKSYTIIRQSSETGQLYGSVSSRDIASLISTDGACEPFSSFRHRHKLSPTGASIRAPNSRINIANA